MTKSKLNTIDKSSYFANALLYSSLTYSLFTYSFFIHLPGLSAGTSNTILLCMIGTSLILCFALSYLHRRNIVSLFTYITLPFSIYVLLSYRKFFPGRADAAMLITASLLIIYLCFFTFGPIRNKGSRKRAVMRRISRTANSMCFIIAVCLAVFVASIAISTGAGSYIYRATLPSVESSQEADDWTIANNIDTVRMLEEEVWRTLTPEQKMNVLGVIRNIEIRYLGIDHQVELRSAQLDGTTSGCYNDKRQCIIIDIDHLINAPAADVLQTFLHEIYHCYQYAQIRLLYFVPEEYSDLYLLGKAHDYAYEAENYIDGDEDYAGYISQSLELDACSYSFRSVDEYYAAIASCDQSQE